MSAHPIRTITYNVLKCTGWNRRFDQANQPQPDRPLVPDHIAAALAARNPDIITLCEAPEPGICHGMAAQLGMKCAFFSSPAGFPGALLTRFDISDAIDCPTPTGHRPEGLFTRHWGKAELALPDGETLVVHQAHLYPGREPEARDLRLREQATILDAVRNDLVAEHSVIIQGDLNHLPRDPEYAAWRDAWLVDAFSRVGEGDGFTVEADRPVARIDYIFLGGHLAERKRETRVLSEDPFSLDPEDQHGHALSDHLPLMCTIHTQTSP